MSKKKKDDNHYYINGVKSYVVPKPKQQTTFEKILSGVGFIIGMTLIIATCLAMCSFSPRPQCGDVIGSFNDVPVYYNDGFESCGDRNWSSDGSYSYGMKWQCVEYVRRYYYDALDHAMPNRWGNASDYFRYSIPSGEINMERDLVQYHNGDTKPQVNDILVWTQGYGHVAIVTAVEAEGVVVIGQNTGSRAHEFVKVKQNKHGKWIIDKEWCAGLLRLAPSDEEHTWITGDGDTITE